MSIRSEIQDFLRRSGMSPSAFGQAALGDPCFLGKLSRGEIRVGPARRATIRVWLNENRDLKVAQPQRSYEPSGTGLNVALNSDLWDRDAVIASAMLRDALMLHHPERCAA